jgi:hypothetical protein
MNKAAQLFVFVFLFSCSSTDKKAATNTTTDGKKYLPANTVYYANSYSYKHLKAKEVDCCQKSDKSMFDDYLKEKIKLADLAGAVKESSEYLFVEHKDNPNVVDGGGTFVTNDLDVCKKFVESETKNGFSLSKKSYLNCE